MSKFDLNSVIGREIKLVRMNDCRFDEFEQPMLYEDELVRNNLMDIFLICDYDVDNDLYAIYTRGGNKLWLYRDEFIMLFRNLYNEDQTEYLAYLKKLYNK